MDLSNINGSEAELLSIQTTLNGFIDKIGFSISHLNISTRATTPKKINYINYNLSIVINDFNVYAINKHNQLKKRINNKSMKANKSKSKADAANQKSMDANNGIF